MALRGRVSNRSGAGVKVEMRAGSLRSRLETSIATPAAAQSAGATATTATDITRAESMRVLASMNPDGVADQQIRVVDIGKYNVAVGILHRSGKAKQTAISHSQVTEIYYVIDGAGTFVTGGKMSDATTAPADGATVKIFVAKPLPARDPKGIAGKLGEVVVVEDGGITVVCADGRFKITRVQPADGKKIDAGEWAKSVNLAKGTILS